MQTIAKACEVKLKDGRTVFFDGITAHTAKTHELKLYRGVEVVAQFDMAQVSSWFVPDRIEGQSEI